MPGEQPGWINLLRFRKLISGRRQYLRLFFTARPSVKFAELVANYFGGHVASIPNEAEQSMLATVASGTTMANFNSNYFYIGLTDVGNPGTYAWLDGTPLNYTNWAPGYPAVLTLNTFHDVLYGCKGSGCQWGPAPGYYGESPGIWRNIDALDYSGAEAHFYVLRLPVSRALANCRRLCLTGE